MIHFIKVLRGVYLVLLVTILLPYGSVPPLALHALATAMLAVAALALLAGPLALSSRLLVWGAMLQLVLLSGWIALQSTGTVAVSPIWREASEALGVSLPASLSVQPADTVAALVQVALPFATFVAGLVLFAGDRPASFLLRFLVASGMVLTVLGLMQFMLFPQMLLATEKQHYRDSLTLTFVNRNTAATYLGVVLTVSVAMVFRPLRDFLGRARKALLSNSQLHLTDEDLWLLPSLLGASVVVTALMLTQSRAGITAALAGLLMVTLILISKAADPPTRRDKRRRSRSDWSSAARHGLAVILVVGAGLFLAGRTLLRAQVHGVEDTRLCMLPRMLELLQDNWLLGTGLATFRQAFGGYRDPACGIYGVWDMAHNFYLEGWITLGLPFVVACLISLGGLSAAFIIGLVRRRRQRWVAAAGLGALLVTAAHSAVDFSLQIPGFSVVFAAFMASCATICLRNPAAEPRTDRGRLHQTVNHLVGSAD